MKRFAVIIPVLNAEAQLDHFFAAFERQTLKPSRLIVIDSSSRDNTVKMSLAAGAEVMSIAREEFNHGKTRMMGVTEVQETCDIVVFLTQDAILADDESLQRIISRFDNSSVDAVYGRQLPHRGAGPIESFARLHNYPQETEYRTRADIARLGFKACFCSNSFAAYRIKSLMRIGGFPDDCILGEDTLVVARMILDGGTICYDSDAQVFHSHNYRFAEEFGRYFDIGVMHARARGLFKEFGSPSGAGKAFVISELRFVAEKNIWLVPEVILRTIIKYIAYNMGKAELSIPIKIKRHISMNRKFWRD